MNLVTSNVDMTKNLSHTQNKYPNNANPQNFVHGVLYTRTNVRSYFWNHIDRRSTIMLVKRYNNTVSYSYLFKTD